MTCGSCGRRQRLSPSWPTHMGPGRASRTRSPSRVVSRNPPVLHQTSRVELVGLYRGGHCSGGLLHRVLRVRLVTTRVNEGAGGRTVGGCRCTLELQLLARRQCPSLPSKDFRGLVQTFNRLPRLSSGTRWLRWAALRLTLSGFFPGPPRIVQQLSKSFPRAFQECSRAFQAHFKAFKQGLPGKGFE